MGFVGIFKGLAKIGNGIIERDLEQIGKGVIQTAGNTTGVIVTHIVEEEVGKAICDASNTIAGDEPDDA